MDLYALTAAELLAVVDTYWLEEVAEMRLLTTLAAVGGAKLTMPPTREFIEKVREESELASAQSADSEQAIAAAQAAEGMFGGPA